MSESKSWDIAPKPAPQAPKRGVTKVPAKAPVRTMDGMRPRATIPTAREAVRPVARSARVPLGRRRRIKRKRLALLLGIILLIFVALAEVIIWQNALRVQAVQVEGPGAESIREFVQAQLTGSRYLIVPNNSIFFIPEKRIRAAVLTAYPEIEAVSIAPSGLTTLTLKTTGRATVLWWCGAPEATAGTCYQADAQGFIFSEVPEAERMASSSTLSVYAALAPAPAGTTAPRGSHIAGAERLPALIQFIKALRGLGAEIVSVTIRDDEADIYTRAGTRITYVLGREQAASNLASSGLPSLNVNDGSLLYVDLRFDSKVFFKKKDMK